ncbi:MAG TPA: KEOPS complex subunit Pcc1 [Nitrososphaerales archaeon]|nr:KEOPS complex subunit Pcc1 [Nitrososphaerales archaeon]
MRALKKLSADLVVELEDARTARSINEALIPDNVNLPEGMVIEQRVMNRFLRITILVEDGSPSLETLISTLDEFVSHIHTVTQTLDRIETLDDRHKDPKRNARKDKGKSRK